MEIIRDVAYIQPYHSRVYDEYFDGLKVCVMDIETTGLNPNRSQVILGGLLVPEEECAELVQYFTDREGSEENLLRAYGDALSSADVLITYNGSSFDLPFMRQRFRYRGLDYPLNHIQSFDLYRALHYYSKMREILPNLKQKSIEIFLGLSPLRQDEISGGESVALYEEYLHSGSPASKQKVLLHNRDDLVQLASIVRILEKLDLHRILFYEGFTVTSGDKRAYVKSMTLTNKVFTITADTENMSLDYYSFETGYQAIHKAEERKLTVTIPFERRQGADFVDLESIDADFSQLLRYPSYESGYLILREKGKMNYAEVNKAVRIILGMILEAIMV